MVIDMNNENTNTGKNAYRKLVYFYENKIPVHFCLVAGGWKNGVVIDLSESKLSMVLNERVEGILPFLLEDIDENTIEAYKEKGVEDGR